MIDINVFLSVMRQSYYKNFISTENAISFDSIKYSWINLIVVTWNQKCEAKVHAFTVAKLAVGTCLCATISSSSFDNKNLDLCLSVKGYTKVLQNFLLGFPNLLSHRKQFEKCFFWEVGPFERNPNVCWLAAACFKIWLLENW